jgi:hypothetical protein
MSVIIYNEFALFLYPTTSRLITSSEIIIMAIFGYGPFFKYDVSESLSHQVVGKKFPTQMNLLDRPRDRDQLLVALLIKYHDV